MPASSEPSALRKLPALEFLVGKHSMFVAAMGQAFFYLHLFKPHLPVWVAGPFFMIPWGIMFVLFYHEKPLISPRTLLISGDPASLTARVSPHHHAPQD